MAISAASAAAVLPIPAGAEAPVEAPRYSLVVARAVSQSDPRPAPCGPDGSCADSLFLGRFDRARTVAGSPAPERFEARIRLHTPLISPVDLAMIVERLPDGALIVRRRAGFNSLTDTACFAQPDEEPVAWQPVAPGVSVRNGVLCYQAS